MTADPCGALREIQLGRVGFEHFAPPEVFTSGLFQQFGVTVADLRWHLAYCAVCGSKKEVRDQLAYFDQLRFTKLIEGLESLQECVQERFRRKEEVAEKVAHMADGLIEPDGEDEDFREMSAEANRELILEQVRPRVYLWAIKLHAVVGDTVGRWLETFLPPAFPRRKFVQFDSFEMLPGDDQIVLDPSDVRIEDTGCSLSLADSDVQIDYTGGRERIQLPPDLFHLLAQTAQEPKGLVFRALLLKEAFGSLVRNNDLQSLLIEGLEPIVIEGLGPIDNGHDIPGGDWQKVWEHYSAFADLEANRLAASPAMAGPTGTLPTPSSIEALAQYLASIDRTTKDLLQGQTPMMDSLERIESAQRQLLEKYDKIPAGRRDECAATIKDALGTLFDALEDSAKKFLITAEYHYIQNPTEVELDFSDVILHFTKAFEAELKRVIERFRISFQEIVQSDAEVKRKKPILRFTLGELLVLLERNESAFRNLEEPFGAKGGLNYDKVVEAIDAVNKEAEAKHLGVRTKADATSFRSLFLGKSSVMMALFPRTENPQR